MTRLIEDWIKDIDSTISDYEQELLMKTGLDLIALASMAADVPSDKARLAAEKIKVGVIPITTGLGIIGTFTESVAAIPRCMGFDTFITDRTDVDGIFEAHRKGAEILFMADDNRFIAVNLERNLVADNNEATAKGFVAALEGAAKGLEAKEVLVIGCGVVGREILSFLRQKGAKPVAYDIDSSVLASLEKEGFSTICDVNEIAEHRLVIDASSQGGWISKGMLHPEVWMVTPGVPLSLDETAYEFYKQRVIHDYLPIGVATMLVMACK